MKPRSTGVWILLALALIGALLLLVFPGVAVEIAYPFGNARQLFSRVVMSRVRGMFRGAAATAENVRLKREVAALTLMTGDLERVERENARLRKNLGYLKALHGDWVAAAVLSREGASAAIRHTLRVNRGSLDGIGEGALVVVPEGLVGRVTSVTAHTAEVLLITDHTVKVACEVESIGARLSGILAGGEERLVLRYPEGPEGVQPRSRVVTSGKGGVFPRGYAVGYFLGFLPGGTGIARVAEVEPAVDFKSLEDVFIRRER